MIGIAFVRTAFRNRGHDPFADTPLKAASLEGTRRVA
jgi:hypothetical protein